MLKVLKTGFFTTVQDGGRFHYRNKGVPVSGAMDIRSFNKANKLLGNSLDTTALEITMTGPTLAFMANTFICISGANLSATINEELIVNDAVYKIKKGDVLSFGKLEKGFRTYLAIKDGFRTEEVLGSSSYFVPITADSCLKEHSEILYEACDNYETNIKKKEIDLFIDETVLEVFTGPEYKMLVDEHLEVLFFKEFTIAKENNRMAYQLKELISGHKISMLTSATIPGTVQLTPSGKLIILMKDGQTTGGYPRILQLSDKAIAILAQKKFGDKITFKLS